MQILGYSHIKTDAPPPLPAVRVSSFDVTLVLGGSLTYVYGDEEYTLRSGDAIIYAPGDTCQRLGSSGSAEYTGRLCVIGSELKEAELKTLFGV